jgi:hypothetical protein
MRLLAYTDSIMCVQDEKLYMQKDSRMFFKEGSILRARFDKILAPK